MSVYNNKNTINTSIIPVIVHRKHQFEIVDNFLLGLLLQTLFPLGEQIQATDDLLVVVPKVVIFLQV